MALQMFDAVVDGWAIQIRPAYEPLAEIPTTTPGRPLMASLEQLDLRVVDTSALLDAMAGWERITAYAHAQRARVMAELFTRNNEASVTFGLENTVLDVSAELHLSRSAAGDETETAIAVCTRLPQVLEMWRAGSIDVRRARVFAMETEHLPEEKAREVVAAVAGQAPEWTAAQLRARLRKLCIELDPRGEVERLEEAVADRTVEVYPGAGGTANLWLGGLSPDHAHGIMERLDSLARQMPPDSRSIDQRRVDAAVGLLLGGPDLPPVPGRGVVDITVGLRTLMQMAEDPGELGGWGPVVAEIARAVADAQQDCTWQATVTDDNGDPYAVALRRRPTASQARQVRARAPRCIFLGCRRPARRCDLDHRACWIDGGPTLQCNLEPLCRAHHRAKDEFGWRYETLGNGDYVWISANGRRYRSRADDP